MKNKLRSIVQLSLIVGLLTSPAVGEDIDVYFITGQSNAGNVGELAGTGSTDVGFNLDFARIFDRGIFDLTDVFQEFSSNSLNPNLAVTELAVNLHDENDIAIYSFSLNGRPLANTDTDDNRSWFPGTDPANGQVLDDELYGAFIVWANDRMNELIARGDTPVVKGIFWFQGEGDVGIGTSATNAYQTNYENLIFRFRQDFGADVVVVGTDIRSVGSTAVQSRQAQVNQALANVAAADSLVEVVPSQDLQPRSASDVHFTDPAYFQLAGRWASAITGVPVDGGGPGDGGDPTVIASSPAGTTFSSFSRIFAGTDFPGGNNNHGRGCTFTLGDNPDGDLFQIDAIAIRKSANQSFSNDASLTLWVFEGTAAQWNAGDGDNDGDPFDGTGITNVPVNAEEFDISGGFDAGDLVRLDLPTPVMVNENSDYGFLLRYFPSTGDPAFFQINENAAGIGGQVRILGDGQEVRTDRISEYMVFGAVVSDAALPGDVNLDGTVDLLDVAPFVDLILNGGFQAEADLNGDGVVDLLDVAPFVALLLG